MAGRERPVSMEWYNEGKHLLVEPWIEMVHKARYRGPCRKCGEPVDDGEGSWEYFGDFAPPHESYESFCQAGPPGGLYAGMKLDRWEFGQEGSDQRRMFEESVSAIEKEEEQNAHYQAILEDKDIDYKGPCRMCGTSREKFGVEGELWEGHGTSELECVPWFWTETFKPRLGDDRFWEWAKKGDAVQLWEPIIARILAEERRVKYAENNVLAYIEQEIGNEKAAERQKVYEAQLAQQMGEMNAKKNRKGRRR